MEQSKVDMYILVNQNCFPAEKMVYLKKASHGRRK